MMRKNNQGITLVELLVGIAIGSLVTLAATTVILMGLRLNRQSMDVTGRQNTARVLLAAMEELAGDGSISGFSADDTGWKVFGKTEKEAQPGEDNENSVKEYQVIYSYVAEEQTVYSGDPATASPFMKGVLASRLKHSNGLLTISVETEDGIFASSIYCRMSIAPSDSSGSESEDVPEADDDVQKPTVIVSNEMTPLEKAARIAFVSVLWDEISSNPQAPNIGIIRKENPEQGKQKDFYSQWYIGDENWGKNGWDEFTPWCACYVSWAIAEVERYTNYKDDNYRPSFAGVDSFLSYFYVKKDGEGNQTHWITADEGERGEKTIYPGDVIFFDWVVDNVRNPQHVGVVLYTGTEEVDGKTVEYVYTIEGNVAASYTDANGRYGTVGLRKYEINDKRILGYGVLDWKTGDLPSTTSEGNS